MRKTSYVMSFYLFIILLFYFDIGIQCSGAVSSDEERKAQKFPPCAACRVLTNSFKKGLERTKREKFDGGDSAWEEDKLGSYSKSETRLIEIQEQLCREVDRGQTQCHTLAEEFESKIEDWWLNHQGSYQDIFDYLCIDQTKRCCPKDHFGPNCAPCPGFPDKICNNNGKCKGAGTRKGNGGCFCDKGYEGETCGTCAPGFYESYRDENKILCSPCHIACNITCTGAGPKNCETCSTGWYMIEGEGCFDIDECLENEVACMENQFCINKEGSHTCLDCDKACNDCTGDGPDMCIECADGYHKKDNMCINSDILGRKRHENFARYTTYVGLCIATCIIFQRNIYIASVIGLFVGIYISVSEYMIANSDVQDTAANVDILGTF